MKTDKKLDRLFEYFNSCDEGFTRIDHSAMDIMDAAQNCGVELDWDDEQLQWAADAINRALKARD